MSPEPPGDIHGYAPKASSGGGGVGRGTPGTTPADAERLRLALKFYADPATYAPGERWDAHQGCMVWTHPPIIQDHHGDLARAVLRGRVVAAAPTPEGEQ